MLTRFVRIQLVIFTIAALVGVTAMVTHYMRAAALLGIGRITVTMHVPESGGLYQFANVTYRGVQIGTVTNVDTNRDFVTATLSLDDSPRIPTDLQAQIRSVSAVGEQFVDLRPNTDSPPFLHTGSVIPASSVVLPQQVGPVLDHVSRLVDTIHTTHLGQLLDESFNAFNGAGSDLSSLLDSSSKLGAAMNKANPHTTQLIDDSVPVLQGQADSADTLRIWAANLAGVSNQLVNNDSQIRTLLTKGTDAAQEVTKLLAQIKSTLPVLLANLTSLGQVAVTYHDSLRQLLVLLPPSVAFYQGENGDHNATGIPVGDFRISVDDPPACTVGFLPQSAWRSPVDTTTIDTPDGLYCKLPQDSPIAVRGARNYPCMDVPGKYAPTVAECHDPRGFQPLAMRQHALGPGPMDPNLIAQGVRPDTRVTDNDHIFGPLQGSPAPPAAAPPPTPASAAPSGYRATDGSAPSVAVATYDPATGRYATPDGHVYRQAGLNTRAAHNDWRSLVLP